MSRRLHLLHDEHFDLLAQHDAPAGEASLGTYRVSTRDGEEARGKYRVPSPGGETVVDVPDDFDVNDRRSLANLAEVLEDRHSAAVTALYSPDDERLGARLAALMGVDTVPVVDHPTYQAHVARREG